MTLNVFPTHEKLLMHVKEICCPGCDDSVIVFLLRTHLGEHEVTTIFRNYSHSIVHALTAFVLNVR